MMPPTIILKAAQSRLKDLVRELIPGQKLVITNKQQPVATYVGQVSRPPHPTPGLGRGGILYMTPDFDGSIEDFFGHLG